MQRAEGGLSNHVFIGVVFVAVRNVMNSCLLSLTPWSVDIGGSMSNRCGPMMVRSNAVRRRCSLALKSPSIMTGPLWTWGRRCVFSSL